MSKSETLKGIGRRIRELREDAKLSQQELALRVGYTSRSSINKIESGKVDLSQTKIAQFAEIFNTTPAYLMGWDDFIAEAEELDKRHREGAKCFGEGVTSINDDNEIGTLVFKDTLHIGRLHHDEERILLGLYQMTNSDKVRGVHTLRILSELVSVMSPEDQDKLISFAEFMEADRQKRLGISVQHPYQQEQE